jgi:hypothetical protein
LWHLQKCLQFILVKFTPLHHSPLSLPFNSFSRSHFSIFIREYTICPPHSPSYTLSSYRPPLSLVPNHRQDLFYLPGHFWKKIFLFV